MGAYNFTKERRKFINCMWKACFSAKGSVEIDRSFFKICNKFHADAVFFVMGKKML